MKKIQNFQADSMLNAVKHRGRLRRAIALLSAFVMLFTMNSLKFSADTLERIPMCGYEYDHVHGPECFDENGLLTCALHEHTDACYQERPVHVEATEVEAPVEEVEAELGGEAAPAPEEQPSEQSAVEEAPADEAPAGNAFDLNGLSTVKLGEIIEAAKLPVSLADIEQVGMVDDAQREWVGITFADGDFDIAVQRDFDEAELGIVVGNEVYTVMLTNGAAATTEQQLADVWTTPGPEGAEVVTEAEEEAEAAIEADDEATTEAEVETEAEGDAETEAATALEGDAETEGEPETEENGEAVAEGEQQLAEAWTSPVPEEGEAAPEAEDDAEVENVTDAENNAEEVTDTENDTDVENATDAENDAEKVIDTENNAETEIVTEENAEAVTEDEQPAEAKEVVETEQPAEAEEVVETEQPAETEEIVETEQPAETEEVAETEQPAEAEENVEIEQPAETEENAETEQPAETEEAVEVEEPVETEEPVVTEEPVETEEVAEDEQPAAVKFHAGERENRINDCTVLLSWGAEAEIPDDVQVEIREIELGSDEYEALYADALERLPEADADSTQVMRFFDITLYTDYNNRKEKVEPKAAVSVEVRVDEVVESDVTAIHYGEEETTLVDATAEGQTVTFEADSFSIYGVAYSKDAEQRSMTTRVQVDLTAVDQMDAATVAGDTVTLSLSELLAGADADVTVRGELGVDGETFVADAEVTTASDVTVEDGAITLDAEALARGSVTLEMKTREVDEEHTTTVVTHTATIELADYPGRTDEVSGEGVTVAPVNSEQTTLPGNTTASAEAVAVPEGIIDEAENAVVDAVTFDITLTDGKGEAIPEPGLMEVTVTPANVNIYDKLPEGAVPGQVSYTLFHSHEGQEPVELPIDPEDVIVDAEGNITEFKFRTSSFSEFTLKYTVDFEYTDPETGETIAWKWPGEGSYAVADIMKEIGVEGEISSVSLERTIDVGGAENVLYLEEKEDGWYLTSDEAFQDTFELTVVVDEKTYVLVVTDAVGESTNLTDFLHSEDENPPAVSLTINGQQVSADSNSPTPVRTGDSFSLNLHLREINGGVQFADGRAMTMTLPAALSGFGDSFTQNINIVLNDTDPSGNPYSVPAVVTIDPVTNTMTLQWPEPAAGQDRTAFDLLKASGNAYVDLTITGTIGENRDELVFTQEIKRYIEENPNNSLSLSKNGSYDKDSGRVNYTVRVDSVGNNNNVTVVDTIENQDKTALVYDSDSNFHYTVYNKDGSVAKATTTFTVSGNSFEQNVGNLTNGQYAVIEYSAKVDTTKITGTGTVEQTGNTVSIKNNTDVPPVSHNLNNQIDWTSVSKSSTGVDGGTDTNNKVAHWQIIANAEQRGSMAGKTITDTIGYNSRNIMTYASDITVEWYDGNTKVGGETINFSDNNPRLTLTDRTDNKGQSWTYTVPTDHNGHNYKYVITYATNVDVSGQLQSIQVTNEVETEGKKGQGQTNVEPGIDKVDLAKKVVPNGTVIQGHTIVTNQEYTSWVAEIEIPSTGLTSAVLEDYLPKTTINGNVYVDEYVPGTLLFDGDWNSGIDDYDFYDFSEDENNPRIRIEFKKKSDGTPGLAGTGSRRTIKVYYQTRNDPTWVETYLPGSNGAEYHINTAQIYVGDRSIQKQASVVPPYPTVKKAAQAYNSINIDGVNYPLYRYTVTLYGITKAQIQAGVTIRDTHDSRLVYHSLRNQWDDELIVGETGYNNGSSNVYPTFSDVETNMTITAGPSCFPLQQNDEPYSYYTLHYYMRGENPSELIEDSIAAITPDGKPGKVEMRNDVEWDGHGDDVTVTYEYPGLDKQLIGTNGRVAQFKLVLNPEGTMIGTSETLKLEDDYENLSVDYSTIHWEPSSVNISYNFKGNKGTYIIPNGTAVTLYYNARILGDGNVNFKNTAKFGDWKDEVDEWRDIGVQTSGGAENFKIRLYKYASDHMEIPLDQTTFKLLDENKQEMHPYLRDEDNNIVTDGDGTPQYDTSKLITFTTGDKGYVTVMLDSSKIGYALEKDKVYYLEETEAHPGYERDYIQYSFEISDSVEYDQKNGVYRYYNNDILKISNKTEEGGLIIVKTLRGINTDNLTAEEQEILDNIKFTIHGKFREEVVNPETGAVTYSEPIEKYIVVTYADFVDGRYRIDPKFLVVGESYTVTESDAYIEGYQLVTTYRADGGSTTGTATDAYVEFTSEDITNTVSHRLSVNNEYSTHSYNFKKAEMGSLAPDFEEGPIYLRGAEFSSYEVDGDGTAKKVYRTDSLGEFGIRWIDHCYEYNKLYYVVETKAPDGYEMLPESRTGEYANYEGPLREKYYFYFSNPEDATPWMPDSVPDGKTAYDLSKGSQDAPTIENGKLEETTTQMEIRKDWKDLNAQGEAGNDISADTIAAKHPEWVENGIPYRVYQVHRKDTEGGAYTSAELRALAQRFLADPESVDCTLFTTEGTPDGEFKITYERGRTYPWYGQVDAEMPLSRTLYGNTTYYGYFVIDEAEGFEPRYDYNGTGFNTDLSHLHLYNTPEQTELHVKKKWIAPNAYSQFGMQFQVYRDAEDGEEGDLNHNGWVYVNTNPQTFTLNSGNNWEMTVSGLKKGYTYHIVETRVTNDAAPLGDWIQAFSGDNQFQGGESVELTNTYDGKALEVKKVWNVDSDEYKNYKVKINVYRRVKGTKTWELWKEPELTKDNSWTKFWKPGEDGFPAVGDTTEYEYYIGDETVYDSNNQLVDMPQYTIVYSATADAPVENQGMMNVTNTKYDGEVTVDKTWLNVDGSTTAKAGNSAEFVLQRAEGEADGHSVVLNLYKRDDVYAWSQEANANVVVGYNEVLNKTKSVMVPDNSNVVFKIQNGGNGEFVEYRINGAVQSNVSLDIGDTVTIEGVSSDTILDIVFKNKDGWMNVDIGFEGSYKTKYHSSGNYEDVPDTTIVLPRDANNGTWSYKWSDLPITTPDGGQYFYTVRETKINGWPVENENSGYTSAVISGAAGVQKGTVTIKNTEKPGSLKLKKLVTVGGQPTEGTLADGTYSFTLKKLVGSEEQNAPAGKSPIVITIEDGVMKSATIGDAAATIGEDGYVEVSGLEKGTYVLYEAETSNGTNLSKLEEGYERDLAARKIVLNVQAGRDGDNVRVAAKGTFTNNIETGTLELNKQIDGSDADPDDEFTFEVSLTLPTGMHDGTFKAVIGSVEQPDITTSNRTAKVENIKLKGGQTYRISGLPIGTQYTIKETNANGYTSDIPAGGISGEITTENSGVSLERVTNTKNSTGFVKVTKAFSGVENLPADFKITASWEGGSAELTTSGTQPTDVTLTGSGTSGDPYTWIIGNLPLDTLVTFAESGFEVNGYTVETTINGKATASASDSDYQATAVAEPEAVPFVNTYTRDKGSLDIEKTVTVNGVTVADTTLVDGTYSFTVQSDTGVTPETTKNFTIKIVGGVVTAVSGDATLVDGKARVTDLPTGKYTVTETLTEAQTKKGITSSATGNNAIEVKKDQTTGIPTASFVNNRDVGDLIVEKKVSGRKDTENPFTFEITLTPPAGIDLEASYPAVKTKADNTVDNTVTSVTFTSGKATVSLKADEKIRIMNLPDGTSYTVTEPGTLPTGYTEGTHSDYTGEISKTAPKTATMNNTYDTSTTTHVEGKKVYTNGTIAENQFSFTISAETGTPLPDPTTVNAGTDGKIIFGEMTYPLSIMDGVNANADGVKTKTFTYKVVENAPSGSEFTAEDRRAGTKIINGIKYDTSEKTVTVTVTYNENTGVMTATPKPATLETNFTNEKLGALKITKVVTVDGSSDIDTTQKKDWTNGNYTFTVEGPTPTGAEPADQVRKYVRITVKNGVADSYRIAGTKADLATATEHSNTSWAIVSDLSEGDYTVTEIDTNGLTLTGVERGDKDSSAVGANKVVTLHVTAGVNDPAADSAAAATFTNNKDLGSLYIKKTLLVNSSKDKTNLATGDFTFKLERERVADQDTGTGEDAETFKRYITISIVKGEINNASWSTEQNGTPIEIEDFDSDNGALMKDLELGRYKLTELVANSTTVIPDGYALRLESVTIGSNIEERITNNSVTFEITKAASTLKVNFTNNLYKNSIQVLKIDQTTRGEDVQTPIKGAEFTLIRKGDDDGFKENPGFFIKGTSNDNGLIEFKNLVDGDYRLEETAIPKGYSRTSDGKYIYFKIEGGVVTQQPNGGELSIIVVNRTSDATAVVTYDDYQFIVGNTPAVALPSTGGMGTGLIYATGTGLLLLAVIAWVMKAKKRDYGAY